MVIITIIMILIVNYFYYNIHPWDIMNLLMEKRWNKQPYEFRCDLSMVYTFPRSSEGDIHLGIIGNFNYLCLQCITWEHIINNPFKHNPALILFWVALPLKLIINTNYDPSSSLPLLNY